MARVIPEKQISSLPATLTRRTYEDTKMIGENTSNNEFIGGIGPDIHATTFCDPSFSFGEGPIRMSSFGGSVIEALAIMNRMKGEDVHIHVDGVAFGAAWLLLCGASRVTADKKSTFAIGRVWTGSYDTANTLYGLKEFEDVFVKELSDGIPCPEDQIRSMMEDEKWLTAEEALDIGLIDAIQ